jgi:hypothetical protein
MAPFVFFVISLHISGCFWLILTRDPILESSFNTGYQNPPVRIYQFFKMAEKFNMAARAGLRSLRAPGSLLFGAPLDKHESKK